MATLKITLRNMTCPKLLCLNGSMWWTNSCWSYHDLKVCIHVSIKKHYQKMLRRHVRININKQRNIRICYLDMTPPSRLYYANFPGISIFVLLVFITGLALRIPTVVSCLTVKALIIKFINIIHPLRKPLTQHFDLSNPKLDKE